MKASITSNEKNKLRTAFSGYFPTSLQQAYKPDPRKPRNCPITFNCKHNTNLSFMTQKRKKQTERNHENVSCKNKNEAKDIKGKFSIRPSTGICERKSKTLVKFILTVSNGSPPKIIQPSPMVKRSYNSKYQKISIYDSS